MLSSLAKTQNGVWQECMNLDHFFFSVTSMSAQNLSETNTIKVLRLIISTPLLIKHAKQPHYT